ncbi:hypothetical protein BB559_006689 [Furculomyces boomerangus]|uniref:Synaptobrevin homolog YKT6 n=2 Tax=Harpellales TaxID=61421 RepID=A0A2T9Y174_9FUNG|nr:hypothetical protein BB559_006689 [Furculomyces boomerangus]PVZ99698.1 hypothetical protein BB558_004266 [Smittium angustum]
MKVYFVGVIRSDVKPAAVLSKAVDVSSFSFFQRTSIQDFLTFFASTVAERTRPGQRQGVDENNYTAYVYNRSDGLAGAVVTDSEYPSRVALSLAGKILDEFSTKYTRDIWTSSQSLPFPLLDKLLVDYQTPSQADTIMNVQQELDETKVVLHKTIESVLERGERLDNLVEKSNMLSDQSKMFYKTAKKTNSCCSIM